jgi:hypothetical protein
MATRLKRAVMTGGIVLSLAYTTLLGGASPASAAPCGLSGHYGATAQHVKVHTFYYTIRQCNGYTVRRELDIANGPDNGTCHAIRGYSQASGSITLPKFMYVRDKKPC